MIPERSFNMMFMFWSFELDDEQVRTKREEGKRLRWKQLQSMPILILLTRALNDNKDYTSNENSKFPRFLKDVVTFRYQCARFFCYTRYKFEKQNDGYKKRCLFVDNAKTETTTQEDLKTGLTNRIAVN